MEKLLAMSNFSFSHSVFKRLVLQTGKNLGLFGKGLRLFKAIICDKVVDSVDEDQSADSVQSDLDSHGPQKQLRVGFMTLGVNPFCHYVGVLPASVVECLTHNPGFLGSSHTGSSGVFMGLSLDRTLQNLSLVLVKSRKDMNNVSCRCDMTEILMKAA